ncbi:MAG: tetratricopeptide repeat protein [Betaproteobacteria bacterium]
MLHALLFTDAVDSTRTAERLGDRRAAELWAEHDRRSRDLLDRHHGREIGRADGFFLLFESADAAARYALDYHRALTDLEIATRAGLHVGPVTLRENLPEDVARGAIPIEVQGLAMSLTARLMALAGGGQTLLSRAAREGLQATLPHGAELERHGYYRLKGIEEPVEVFELGVPGTSPFSPPADVDKAYRVVRVNDLWCPIREVRHNLPAERDTFVGRIADLHALATRLDAGTRLLTILGPGGTGKTRLVRRYGWTWLGEWPGGVYFCDLSEARSLDSIHFAVASALGVRIANNDPGLRLGDVIAGRGRCLVIFDNFEQVVEHAPATLGRWLDRAADAAFVVTSRERLNIPGEEGFPIEPLPLNIDAIELFAVRARAQRPDFVVSDANHAAVAEVVRLLDGLPLAIELAAARIRVLSPAQLVERMRDRFSLLAGARGAAARQATLRAAIDWSWDLLTHWEQAAFAQCSVFEGGFALDAAEAVLSLSPWPDAPLAMDAVQALVDKSLLRTWVPEQARFDIEEPHFGMYISVHEYAAEKLKASGAVAQQDAEERHGRHFAAFGTDAAHELRRAHGGVERVRALALELDNLVAACRRAVRRGNGAVAAGAYCAAWEVLDLRGPFSIGDALGAEVLALDGIEPALRAAAYLTRAQIARRVGRMEEAEAGLAQALVLTREGHDPRLEGIVLAFLGSLCRDRARMDEALAHQQQALAVHRAVGNQVHEGYSLGNLGNLHAEQGRMDAARAHFEQALAIHRKVGNRSAEGLVLGNMGLLLQEQGGMKDAQAHLQHAIAIHREVGNRHEEGIVIGNLGALHLAQGRMQAASTHFEAALAIARDVGDRRHEGHVLGALSSLRLCQGRMEEARAHCERALSIHRAVANRRSEGEALGTLGDILAGQGRIEEARKALDAGEDLLRQIGDRLRLGGLLCVRGRVEAAAGEREVAKTKLVEAEAIARAVGAGPDSGFRREIDTLRQALT